MWFFEWPPWGVPVWDRARGASTEHSLGHQRCCPAQGPPWGHSPSPRCSSAPPQLPTRNPRVPRAAEGNQSTGLKGCLENISSSLPIICLKIPINVYTYVPGRHVYPQLMARRGSWRDLCAAAPARSQPALIYSFSPHRLLLTSSNPIPITASHLPFNVNKSCVVGPLLPAQIKAVMLMEEKHNLRPARKAGRKIKHGGHRGSGVMPRAWAQLDQHPGMLKEKLQGSEWLSLMKRWTAGKSCGTPTHLGLLAQCMGNPPGGLPVFSAETWGELR